MFGMRLRLLVLLSALIAPFAPAATAATIVNKDADAVIILVVENGNRSEMVVEPGATNTLCDGGCFLTLPNGDRIGLSGSETIRIVNGVAIIQ